MFIAIGILMGIAFLFIDFSNAKEARKKQEYQDKRDKLDESRYFKFHEHGQGHFEIDLETLAYNFVPKDPDYNSSVQRNHQFSPDLKMRRTYNLSTNYGLLNLIVDGFINDESVYRDRFEEHDGSPIDKSNPINWLGYPKELQKDPATNNEWFRKQHEWEENNWDISIMDKIKNTRDFYFAQKNALGGVTK